jgi:hypothetical protein
LIKAKETRSGEIKGKLARERERKMMEKASEQIKGEEEWGDREKVTTGERKKNEGELWQDAPAIIFYI